MNRLITACCIVLLVTSCTHATKVEQDAPPAQFKQCPDERSSICTREYLPVCATRDTGIRCVAAPCPSSEQKTYGNACTACADEKVSGYIPDVCPADSPAKPR